MPKIKKVFQRFISSPYELGCAAIGFCTMVGAITMLFNDENNEFNTNVIYTNMTSSILFLVATFIKELSTPLFSNIDASCIDLLCNSDDSLRERFKKSFERCDCLTMLAQQTAKRFEIPLNFFVKAGLIVLSSLFLVSLGTSTTNEATIPQKPHLTPEGDLNQHIVGVGAAPLNSEQNQYNALYEKLSFIIPISLVVLYLINSAKNYRLKYAHEIKEDFCNKTKEDFCKNLKDNGHSASSSLSESPSSSVLVNRFFSSTKISQYERNNSIII